MIFSSYRSRLTFYSLLLITFLTGTLVYSYKYIHQVMLDEADEHLTRLKQLLNSHLKTERNELQRYATLVAHDLRLQEYLYVVTGIGGDSEPLGKLYDREFGWLPIDRKMILDGTNRALTGKQHDDLADAIKFYFTTNQKGIFYFQGKKGMELVAVAPVEYRTNYLGRVVVTRLINQEWLNTNKAITGGEFFLVANDNTILKTTLQNVGKVNKLKLNHNNNRIEINSNTYRIHEIKLPGNNTEKPELWFGLSEDEIITKLDKHREFMFVIIGIGMIGIMLITFVIVRSITKPLNKLMHVTRDVAAGDFPVLDVKDVQNEFDELSNNFAVMIQGLRSKQQEIERTHEQLEQSAITDSLTGLYNRRYLMEIYPKLLAQADREALSVYATLMDLDHFKKINDSYGHIAGDQCLIAFADQLKNESRASDYLFRIGGEEFLVLSIHKNIMDAVNFADKLRLHVANKPVHYDDRLITMTLSGGVCCAKQGNSPDSSLKELLSCADIALYKAKHAGRNRVCLSNPQDSSEIIHHSTS